MKEFREDSFEADLDADLAMVASLHESAALLAAVTSVLEQLPRGGVHLVSTSAEGCAVAAGCVLMAPQRALSWHLTNVARVDLQLPNGKLVVVEAMDPGEGWRDAVQRRLPAAAICVPEVQVRPVAAAS